MSNTLRLARNSQTTSDAETPDPAELRMRRALGLTPPETAGRSASPVVRQRGTQRAGSPVNRVAMAEAALATEQQAREQAERRLRDADAALAKITTKLGQMELSRDEALAALAVERGARETDEARLRDLTPVPISVTVRSGRKRGRPPNARKQPARFDDDQPVEWWVPGWQDRVSG